MFAARPRLRRHEGPAPLLVLQRVRSLNNDSRAICDVHHALGQGVIERLGEGDGERRTRAGGGRLNLPRRRINRRPIRRTNGEVLLKTFLQRSAVGIRPVAINHQGEALALFQRGTDFLQRRHAALDATRIDEEGQSCHLRIPKFLIDFQERQRHVLARRVSQMDVLVDAPAAHRRGEVDVEFEQILRQHRSGGINLSDHGGRIGGPTRQLERGTDELTSDRAWQVCRIKRRHVAESRFEWKLRLELNDAFPDAICAEHGRHSDAAQRVARLGMDSEQLLPLRRGPVRIAQCRQRFRVGSGHVQRPPCGHGVGNPAQRVNRLSRRPACERQKRGENQSEKARTRFHLQHCLVSCLGGTSGPESRSEKREIEEVGAESR